jgi:hypothetical protein
MNTGKVIKSVQEIPAQVQHKLQEKFPQQTLSDFVIRYYSDVADVGYEYFVEKVLPASTDAALVQYLKPFISFPHLGEALILDATESILIYDSNHGDRCTETGPFWLVTSKVASISMQKVGMKKPPEPLPEHSDGSVN